MWTRIAILPCFVVMLMAGIISPVAGRVNVVATTEDLASLAREVGGDMVNVMAIARGYQDPHFVNPKPSYLLKLRKADLLIAVGRELEVGWLPALVQQSRNKKLRGGGNGYLDASIGCSVLQQSTMRVDRSMGDVHPFGNPHYWLTPNNGIVIATNISTRLSEIDPDHADHYRTRLADFVRRLKEASARWDALISPYSGTSVVTYHNSWPNFAQRYGLHVFGYVEPKPGVPPSPAHTLNLIQQMKSEGVKIIIVEPYFNLKTPEAIARATGARVVVLMPSVGGTEEITDYFSLFDYNLNLLETTFKEVGISPKKEE